MMLSIYDASSTVWCQLIVNSQHSCAVFSFLICIALKETDACHHV